MATRPAKATGNPLPHVPGAQGPARRHRPVPASAAAPGERPRALRLAAAVQALEAVGMCVAAGFAAVSTADGQSYQRASGVALTLIAVGTAVVFALFAVGLAKARPWTRTPVVMTQLAIGAWGIYLLKDHRLDWGVPSAAGSRPAAWPPCSPPPACAPSTARRPRLQPVRRPWRHSSVVRPSRS